jgi:hypothetical protein
MARRVNYRDAAIWQRSVVKRTFQAGAQTDAFDPERTLSPSGIEGGRRQASADRCSELTDLFVR